MTQFKILAYALYRCRSHFFASDPHVKLGGTNLQKKKLIRSALHLAMFAAQRFQPVAQRPLVAHVVSPDMLACQLATTQLLVVKISVFARCATFPDSYTVLVDSNLHFCSCIHFFINSCNSLLRNATLCTFRSKNSWFVSKCQRSLCPFDAAKICTCSEPSKASFRSVQLSFQLTVISPT